MKKLADKLKEEIAVKEMTKSFIEYYKSKNKQITRNLKGQFISNSILNKSK